MDLELKFSATKAIFYEANQFDEKLSEIIFFVVLNSPLCALVPWIIYIFFIYFTTDLGNDAFELPVQMWYVKL